MSFKQPTITYSPDRCKATVTCSLEFTDMGGAMVPTTIFFGTTSRSKRDATATQLERAHGFLPWVTSTIDE
ncbi:hypothetical protein PRIPAC_96776 [Pristionchus pacificus]|uniref:Uncharacterized protein n=1 Tax=Pristionchus pacificus TaxID=54126 RepID=A0A2A6D249_PRIPA|nr:hypothetical protein PRIPAC_96776 [Pristionchus pacificus]|eukprot:PDM84552.1 hypothetical protein PRIPAC_33575 [Pristionchus pacificus]